MASAQTITKLLAAGVLVVSACAKSQNQGPSAGTAAAERRIATLTLTRPQADPKLDVPAPVARDLETYVNKRVTQVRSLLAVDAAGLDAARQHLPPCQTGPADTCLRALTSETGATLLVALSIERLGPDDCRVNVTLAANDSSALTTQGPTSRCHLQDLEAAAEAALGEHAAFKALKASPPPPHPPCENLCTQGERSCDGRSTTVCDDSNWDGCTDWLATPCDSGRGCSKGACIADLPGMSFVNEGPYLMGSGQKQLKHAMELCQARSYTCIDSWWRPEQPAHWVQVAGFYIDTTEVTNAAYAACTQTGQCKKQDMANCRGWDTKGKRWVPLGALPSEFNRANAPVVCVNFEEAERYCHAVGKRLPTEAEWEKAARGTDGRIYPWGDAPYDGSQANGCDARCGEVAGKGWRVESNLNDKSVYVAEVGSYPAGASPYGALDMAGNVWEWVADWFDEDYYKISERRDPTGPSATPEKDAKVLRGGSWSNEPDSLRASYRYSLEAKQRLATVGFRCAAP